MGGGGKNEKKINESNKLEGETKKKKMGRKTSFMDNVNFSFLSSN